MWGNEEHMLFEIFSFEILKMFYINQETSSSQLFYGAFIFLLKLKNGEVRLYI